LLTYLLFGAADLGRDPPVRFALGDAPQRPLFPTPQYWEARSTILDPATEAAHRPPRHIRKVPEALTKG